MIEPYYQTDLGTLYCGDWLEVMKQLPDNTADLLITDPPYFQPAVHYCPPRGHKPQKRQISDMSIFKHFMRMFFDECSRVIKSTGSYYIFCDGQSYSAMFEGLFLYVNRVRPLVWDKLTSVNGYTWRHQHELIAWGEGFDAERVNTGDGDILKCKAVPVNERKHPAEKPIKLISRLIEKHNPECVLDPFGGSSTVALACVPLHVKWIIIELAEDYCAISKDRIEKEAQQLKLFPGSGGGVRHEMR